MIKNGRPFCDECHGELVAWTREQAEDYGFCGWDNWRTAHKHYCSSCYDVLFEKWSKAVGFPACGECETFPCKKGRDCWDRQGPPLHWFPCETFFGELVGSTYPVDNDFDSEEPVDSEIIRTQKMQQAGHQKTQTKIDCFLEVSLHT